MTFTDAAIVTVDLYRNIHKGIRAELFAVTGQAGRIDSADRSERVALAEHVTQVVDLLVTHAEHEDGGIQPALERHLPALAAKIAYDHVTLDERLLGLRSVADAAVDVSDEKARPAVHRVYLDLAEFTGIYLAHQEVEERTVMPALEAALGADAMVEIERSIIGSIPPAQLASSLAIMLPAMNVDDRAEMLGGMRAGAPAEVFEGVWGLAGSALTAADHQALARRLGIA
jgi:hypothetical protein